MKTIKELSVLHQIDRNTLFCAAKQGRIPARQSGTTWLIDDEHDDFKAWLEAHWQQPRTKGQLKKKQQNNQSSP